MDLSRPYPTLLCHAYLPYPLCIDRCGSRRPRSALCRRRQRRWRNAAVPMGYAEWPRSESHPRSRSEYPACNCPPPTFQHTPPPWPCHCMQWVENVLGAWSGGRERVGSAPPCCHCGHKGRSQLGSRNRDGTEVRVAQVAVGGCNAVASVIGTRGQEQEGNA